MQVVFINKCKVYCGVEININGTARTAVMAESAGFGRCELRYCTPLLKL
jgi:hypothetical protein